MNTVIVENNQTAQMASVIRENTGIRIENRILKYDGRPFSPEELYTKFKEMLVKKEISREFSNNHFNGSGGK